MNAPQVLAPLGPHGMDATSGERLMTHHHHNHHQNKKHRWMEALDIDEVGMEAESSDDDCNDGFKRTLAPSCLSHYDLATTDDWGVLDADPRRISDPGARAIRNTRQRKAAGPAVRRGATYDTDAAETFQKQQQTSGGRITARRGRLPKDPSRRRGEGVVRTLASLSPKRSSRPGLSRGLGVPTRTLEVPLEPRSSNSDNNNNNNDPKPRGHRRKASEGTNWNRGASGKQRSRTPPPPSSLSRKASSGTSCRTPPPPGMQRKTSTDSRPGKDGETKRQNRCSPKPIRRTASTVDATATTTSLPKPIRRSASSIAGSSRTPRANLAPGDSPERSNSAESGGVNCNSLQRKSSTEGRSGKVEAKRQNRSPKPIRRTLSTVDTTTGTTSPCKPIRRSASSSAGSSVTTRANSAPDEPSERPNCAELDGSNCSNHSRGTTTTTATTSAASVVRRQRSRGNRAIQQTQLEYALKVQDDTWMKMKTQADTTVEQGQGSRRNRSDDDEALRQSLQHMDLSQIVDPASLDATETQKVLAQNGLQISYAQALKLTPKLAEMAAATRANTALLATTATTAAVTVANTAAQAAQRAKMAAATLRTDLGLTMARVSGGGIGGGNSLLMGPTLPAATSSSQQQQLQQQCSVDG